MTYLLTEIALGLLGHKFFDVYGVRKRPCLNENSFASIDDTNDDSFDGELLQIDHNKEESKNLNFEKESGNASIDLNDDEVSENAEEEETKEDAINIASDNENYTKETMGNGLTKLLNYERSKLREEIRCNKTSYMQSKAHEFKIKQKLILSNEKTFLIKKRKEVEKDFAKINFDKYQKYIKTFKRPLWSSDRIQETDS